MPTEGKRHTFAFGIITPEKRRLLGDLVAFEHVTQLLLVSYAREVDKANGEPVTFHVTLDIEQPG